MNHTPQTKHKLHSYQNTPQCKPLATKLILSTAFVALLLSICIMPAMADDVSHQHDDDDIDWQPWGYSDRLPDSGSYYLTQDVYLSEPWKFANGQKVDLCLNGFIIAPDAGAILNSIIWLDHRNAELNLYDCNTSAKHYFDKQPNGLWILNRTLTE